MIKLFEKPSVMDWSLLVTTLSFLSSAMNTMNLRFGMMTLTILDMAALFGLSPHQSVKVNFVLTAPKAEESFKAAWPVVAKLVARKVKNMHNYSSFYNLFGVVEEVGAENDSQAPI